MFIVKNVALKISSLVFLGLVVLFFFLKERKSVYFMSSRSSELKEKKVFEETVSLNGFKFKYLGNDGWKMSPKGLTLSSKSDLDKAIESLREIDQKILFVEGASNEGREWDGPMPDLSQFHEKKRQVREN